MIITAKFASTCPDYQQGLAEGRRYSAEVKVYGQAMADRFAMADEMARYNAGEDY